MELSLTPLVVAGRFGYFYATYAAQIGTSTSLAMCSFCGQAVELLGILFCCETDQNGKGRGWPIPEPMPADAVATERPPIAIG